VSCGTLVGWAAISAIYFVWPHPVLLGLSLLVTISFTILLLAHIVALITRTAAVLRMANYVSPPGINMARFVPQRRVFILSVGRGVLTGLLGAFFSMRTFGRLQVASAETIPLRDDGSPMPQPPPWWETDPFLDGDGLGIVLHKTEGDSWLIAGVLEESPAMHAGVQVGDQLVAIDIEGTGIYPVADGDLTEILFLIRRTQAARHTLHVLRQLGTTGVVSFIQVSSSPIFGIVSLDGGIWCHTCRKCYPTSYGWDTCGQSGCSDACAIV